MTNNYPPGETGATEAMLIKHICKDCTHEWMVDMYSELGGLFYLREEEVICPKCGSENEEE